MPVSSFQFVALPADRFTPLFSATDAELASLGAQRAIVDERPGFPCRVSLVDAELGETVILLPFTHHDVASPYRASGPIYVRNVPSAAPARGEVPPYLRHRLLSLRGYDEAGMMRTAEVVAGIDVESAIASAFADARVRYLHVHNARPGCFNCAVERAD